MPRRVGAPKAAVGAENAVFCILRVALKLSIAKTLWSRRNAHEIRAGQGRGIGKVPCRVELASQAKRVWTGLAQKVWPGFAVEGGAGLCKVVGVCRGAECGRVGGGRHRFG